MRKVIVFVLAAMLISSACFAQESAAPKTEEFGGTVDSINPIDPSRGADEGSIYVRDDAGKVPMFIINSDTAVTDASSNKISSADINDGSTVKVTYRTTADGKIAQSISVVNK